MILLKVNKTSVLSIKINCEQESNMSIKKTQQFLYFQNKAKHYDTIRNMRAIVNDKLQKQFIKQTSPSKKPSIQQKQQKKRKRFIPLMKDYDIQQQNINHMERIIKLNLSSRTEVQAQGNYSRLHKVERKFRQTNPFNNQLNRTIQLTNNQHHERIKHVRPRIGSSIQWDQHFGKTVHLKKNMSRYLQTNRSKATLHISYENFVPSYFDSYVDKSNFKNGSVPKQIQITHEGILTLPAIQSKQISHSIRQTKTRLIIDRSRSSLNRSQKDLSSLNPQVKTKTNLLKFKFDQSSKYQSNSSLQQQNKQLNQKVNQKVNQKLNQKANQKANQQKNSVQ